MLPYSVRIGGVDYEVVEVEGLHDEGQELNGWIQHSDCRILVRAGLPPAMQLITLWHEVIHGLLEAAGQEHEEVTVHALGYGVVQIIRDNPWLRRTAEESAYD